MVGPDKFVMPVGLDHAISGLMDQVTLRFKLAILPHLNLKIVDSLWSLCVMLIGAEVGWNASSLRASRISNSMQQFLSSIVSFGS